MVYQIKGLDPATFADTEALIASGALRVRATGKPGFPCRVTLDDAEPGEALLLLNHVSHDVATPFRSAFAIYVREGAAAAPEFIDTPPPFLNHRTLGLRGFDADGMLRQASIAGPGEADPAIRGLLQHGEVAYIDIHNAGAGCFMARAERYDA
ncbi:MAG TPA: DUF1203 domain-containing protein [Sphingomonas sp.]|nr:DUF1203 domain-containing protein [Sphingomonas sp.]